MQGSNGSDKKLCKGCLSGKGCLAKRKEAEEVRGRCGQLLLTPTSIVAPVGGEVILLAGVCGKDEYLVTNEPIEWMLSPTSVGEILEVGDDAKGQTKSSWRRDDSPKVEKLDVDFARGRTSKEASRITRGTSNPADDLPIRKGQTWISLTSATEGVSKVTALAPDSDVWDKRRQTANIYWIDASWSFPQPEQHAQAGEKVLLTTRVMKSEGLSPAEGWIVRYRIMNPGFAKFLVNDGVNGRFSDIVEAKVSREGVAIAELVNEPDRSSPVPPLPFGTAVVDIEIIRPVLGDNFPSLNLGHQVTQVTWSAPALIMEAGGPEIAVPGQPLNYFVNLKNIGDQPAENVVLSVVIPSGMRFLPETANYGPEAQPTDNVLRWPLGPLPPRSIFELRFALLASAPMDARVQFDALGTPNLRQQSTVQTQITQPQLTLQLTPDQNRMQVEIGNEASFQAVITNTGNQTVNNVLLSIKSDPGLRHVNDGRTEIGRQFEFINPGQSVPIEAVFIVQREGELCVDATISSLNQVLGAQKACIRGLPATPKQPSMRLELSQVDGTNPLQLGAECNVTWAITNTGPVTLTNLVVSMQHDPSLQVTRLSNGVQYAEAQQLGVWRIDSLRSNARVELNGTFRGVNASNQSGMVVVVESANGISDRKTLAIPVGNQPGVGTGGTGGTGGVMPPPSGVLQKPASEESKEPRLGLSIRPVSNSIHKGDTGTYEIRIENLQNKPDQKISLRIKCPEGSKLVSIQSNKLQYKLSDNDRQIDFEPIQYFRATDSFSCELKLKHEEVASVELLASVASMGQSPPIVKRLAIQVSP